MLLVPGATRIPPVESSSGETGSCLRQHPVVAFVVCHSSASCVCSCYSSPGSSAEQRTLVLISSIAYLRLKSVTKCPHKCNSFASLLRVNKRQILFQSVSKESLVGVTWFPNKSYFYGSDKEVT